MRKAEYLDYTENFAVNRYQIELSRFDERHRLIVRTLSFAGAALLIVAALWGAGFPPKAWWASLWSSQLNVKVEYAPAASNPSAFSVAEPAASVVTPPAAGGEGTDSSVSPTPLPLYLMATFPGRNAGEGTAQIGTSTTNPQTYSAGALLANGAQLAEIHQHHVVLKKGDRTARLSLHNGLKTSEQSKRDLDALLAVGGEQPVLLTTPNTREVFTSYVRPNPIYDGETLLGFEVYPGQKAGVFSRMGLQSGDVITSINDAPFSDPSQAMDLFNQLTQGVAMVATIKRKGRFERVTLDGSLISAEETRGANSESAHLSAGMAPI
jgi:type II secretion system protein C